MGDRVRVLLVGESEAGFSSVKDHLRGFNCYCEFARWWSSRAGGAPHGSFDLILYSVDVKGFQATAATVLHSSGSVFRCLPVEDGCWWVPTVVLGKPSVGAPALRPNEFAQALDKLILLASRNLAPNMPPAFPFCS
jgi:hypothetical protein